MKKLMARVKFALSLVCVAWLAGCMSMDEMLASEDGFWRDIGEARAVAFATDNSPDHTLEERLAVVPKIKNQKKLAEIYVSGTASAEVKAEARKGLTDPLVFVYVYGKSSDRDVRRDALAKILKDADATLELAWNEGLKKPEDGRKIAARVKDNAKLSRFITGKARGVLDFAEACSKKQYLSEKQIDADNKYILACCGAIGAIGPLAEDAAVVMPYLEERAVRETKDTETDLVTPFRHVLALAAFKNLNDEDRCDLLQYGRIVKDQQIIVLDIDVAAQKHTPASNGRTPARDGATEEERYDCMVTVEQVVASFQSSDERQRGMELLAEHKRNVADRAARNRMESIRYLSATAQKAEVAKIADPVERKNTVFALIDTTKDFDSVTDGQVEMLATIPQKDLAAQLRFAAKEMKGNVQQYRASGPAAVKAIKDQAVIKDLLLDNDSWVHEMGLEEDFGKAYNALLDNITDENLLEEVFRKGKPDEYDRIASKWTLRNLFKRLSAERQEKLRAEVKNRADEQAKKSVVVKGFFLGMSLADYCVVNDQHGMPATAEVDQTEKVTFIYFDNDKRDSFLNVGKGMDGIAKFASLYCKVPDGVDLSQNSRTEMKMVMRSIKHLNFDNNKPGKYRWEYSNFAKYVDHPHNFQAEIQDENGQLTLRYPVDEGVIGTVDKTKEEQNDLLNAF